MPSDDNLGISFHVLVDDKELKEYEHERRVYIESQIGARSSYTMENQMLTPYALEVANICRDYLSICICIDGNTMIRSFILRPGNTKRFNGVQRNGEVKEFTFGLPLEESTCRRIDDDVHLSEVGQINVLVFNVEQGRGLRSINYTEMLPPSEGSQPYFYPASKKDCTRNSNGQGAVVTHLGASLYQTRRTPSSRLVPMLNVTSSRGSLLLTYKPRYALQLMGIQLNNGFDYHSAQEGVKTDLDHNHNIEPQIEEPQEVRTVKIGTPLPKTPESKFKPSEVDADGAEEMLPDSLHATVKTSGTPLKPTINGDEEISPDRMQVTVKIGTPFKPNINTTLDKLDDKSSIKKDPYSPHLKTKPHLAIVKAEQCPWTPKSGERYFEQIDDDIFVEYTKVSTNDSVVYMGDEDCTELVVDTPDISIVELDESRMSTSDPDSFDL